MFNLLVPEKKEMLSTELFGTSFQEIELKMSMQV
jgi:hypothetical protein